MRRSLRAPAARSPIQLSGRVGPVAGLVPARGLALFAVPAALVAIARPVPAGPEPDPPAGTAQEASDVLRGPGPVPVDEFHPDRDLELTPAYGGSVTVHLPGLPSSMNYAIENSAYTRWMLYQAHEFLFQQDWETWELEPSLAKSFVVEDAVIPVGGRGEDGEGVVFGDVRDDGDAWVVTPLSDENPLEGALRIPKDEVGSVERGTVFTIRLRDDVKWHDGHPFDAHDVWFSWSLYGNPDVDCGSIRAYFEKIVQAEELDEHTVRFFYQEQYFRAQTVLSDLTILPSHLYDLSDPQNPDHDPEATQAEQARAINENPHNTQWVGLGPYRVKSWSQQAVELVRFDDYFDPDHGGYLDSITWRHIPNDDTAFQALINGELDFLFRVQSDDYFGEATKKKDFTDTFYKGYYFVGSFNYTPWNMRRPPFDDVRVRKAMAHAIDLEEYVQTVNHGLALLPTGPQYMGGPAYNREVERLEYDLDVAEELLAEAGWYDRDGDGIIDRDGVPFEFEMLSISGNKPGVTFSQKFQENLDKLGIKMDIVSLEWASYLDRLYDREFDAAGLAWSLPVPESDPIQLWHSSGAPVGVRGSNHPGVADEYVDELIEKGDRELDDEKRWAIWRELHRYLYEEVMPYLFREAPPRKFAMNRKIHGLQTFAINPGFSIRRWFYPEGTPGTRATRAR